MIHLNPIILKIILLAVASLSAFAQSPPPTRPPHSVEDIPLAPPALIAEIEQVSGEYRLVVTNNDHSRSFSGLAIVSLGTVYEQAEAGRVVLQIAPRETSIHALYSMPVVGDRYTLVINDSNNLLVLHKIAPVKVTNDPTLAAPPPKPVSTITVKTEETITIKVKPRLAGGSSESDPFMLGFELSSSSQISNAQMTIKAKGLDEIRPVNFVGNTYIEFKLSDDLEAQKIYYKIIGSRGETLASGETDIAQLMNEDVVTISGLRLDKPVYKPGETAKLTISYQGSTTNGIRVEIVVTDHNGKILFRDLRKEKREGGYPQHEFSIPIPKEANESLSIECKVFDGDSQSIIDSGTRDLPVIRS